MHSKLVDKKSFQFKIVPTLLSCVIISIVTFAVFFRSLKGDFLSFDDDWTIYMNPKLGVLNFQNLRSILLDLTVSGTFYTPLTGLRYSITYTLSGLEPFAYHLGNLLFHTAAAVLLFLVVRKILLISLKGASNAALQWRLNAAAILATLIWSLHPLRVELVAWASACMHIQACFFLLLSLLSYFQIGEPGSKSRFWLVVSVVCYAASLLSMPLPTAIVFPAILVVLDVYPLKRLGILKNWRKSKNIRSIIFEKLIFLTITALVIAANIVLIPNAVRPTNHAYVSLTEFGLLDRIMQAFYIWAYYLWRPLYPVNLSPFYTTLWKSFNPLSLPFILSALGIMIITIVIFAIRKRYPSILAAWICYLVLLIPALGLNIHPFSPADRYSYAVSMIWSVLLAGLIVNMRMNVFKLFCSGIVVALIIIGIMSIKQISIWKDTTTLCRQIIMTTSGEPKHPYRLNMFDRLAQFSIMKGNVQEAISYLNEEIQLDQTNPVPYWEIGNIMFRKGMHDEARSYFLASIKARPNYLAYCSLGFLLDAMKRNNEAIEAYQKALEIKPDGNDVNADLGLDLYYHGRMVEAEKQLRIALRNTPELPEHQLILALILIQQKKLDEASHHLRLAVQFKPDLYQAHYVLGQIAAAQGRYAEAVQHFQATLHLRPDFERAKNDIRNILALKRKMH